MSAVVLLAAGGAGWEAGVLALLERAPGAVVLKRCVDADDLLAAAAAGQADAAVVAADLPGLDAAAVEALRHHGVRPIGVVPVGPAGDGVAARAARAGLGELLVEDALGSLPSLLAEPPAAPGDPGDPDGLGGPDGAAGADPLLEAEVTTGAPAGRGRVVAVWGPAGAPGRTTVATAIAAELARRRLPTVLVDADPYGGALAPLLGIVDEVSGLLAAARLATTGDLEQRLPSVLRGVAPHLAVLTGLPRPDRWTELRRGLAGEVAEECRAHGYVVIDTGFSLEEDVALPGRTSRNQLTLDALEVADEVVVVGAPDPVGLARLARGLVDLREVVRRPPHVVVNRMRGSLGWSEKEVAGMLTGVVRTASVHAVPDDRGAVDAAAVAGRTVLETAPESALVRAVAGLVDGFAPPLVGRRADRSRRRLASLRRR